MYLESGHIFSCASEVHIIAMYEPEGSVRGFQQDPSVILDVEVRTDYQCNIQEGCLTPSTNPQKH